MLHATQNSVALWREASKCAMCHIVVCVSKLDFMHFSFLFWVRIRLQVCTCLCCKYVCCFDLFVAMRCTNHWHAQPSVLLLRCCDCCFFSFFLFRSCCCFIIVAVDAVIRMHRSALVNSHAISARRWNPANAMPSDSHAMDARTQNTHTNYSPPCHILGNKKKLFAF